MYARNKALQSAGCSTEPACKALLLAQRTRPPGDAGKDHRVLILHRELEAGDKRILEAEILEIGWSTVDDSLPYLGKTVSPPHRRYLMYDLPGQRRGVTYPAFGPASIEGIARIVTIGCPNSRMRGKAAALQNNKQHSLKGSHEAAAAQGFEIGPLIANFDIPSGYAA